MTLILGVRCSDGIVLGADGSATLGTMGAPTARQQSVKKLKILRDKAVFGLSGPIGLSQLLAASVEEALDKGHLRDRVEHFAEHLRGVFWKLIEPEMKNAVVVQPVVGSQAAASSAICSTILALPVQGRAELLQFNHQASPEIATEELPFVAVGSGQMLADPFLAFIRRVVWRMKAPTVQDGVLAAVWTLQHAIETNPGGIAEPMSIVLLTKERDAKGRDDFVARELAPQALEEHREAVKDAEEQLANWPGKMAPQKEGEAQRPPPQ